MTSELDIYRSAAVLIQQYGEEAPLEAGMRADSMLAKGDVEGQWTWLRIVRAIEELQKTTTAEGEVFH